MNTLGNWLVLIFYTISIVWITLMVIRLDVAQQINKSYELRDTHKQELEQCYEQLGQRYESN